MFRKSPYLSQTLKICFWTSSGVKNTCTMTFFTSSLFCFVRVSAVSLTFDVPFPKNVTKMSKLTTHVTVTWVPYCQTRLRVSKNRLPTLHRHCIIKFLSCTLKELGFALKSFNSIKIRNISNS